MDIIGQVERLLKKGTVDIFLAYRDFCGHPIPHGYTLKNLDDLQNIKTSHIRYSLEKVACRLVEKEPDLKIGIIARDCTERSLNVLYTWNQLKPGNIEVISQNCCPSRSRIHADCSLLEPRKTGSFKHEKGVDFNADPGEFMENNDNGERFDRWMYEFNKCIKCYGCRNICPVCFCPDCSLENPDLVESGTLPPEVPIFHLIKAVHMAGRCVDCGLCEDACPADIPLRFLYRQMNEIVEQVFGYTPGNGIEKSPLTFIGDKVTLVPKPMDAL